MEGKFTSITSHVVPLAIENVDTDQIIPARFLKATQRGNFADNLFRDWRYDQKGNPKPDFILNQSKYRGNILLAGRNFGCGSSREHAAWALLDYGFKVIISSFFADIFRNNALNNGIVIVQVSPDELKKLFQYIHQHNGLKLYVSLAHQYIEIIESKERFTFDINPYKKLCITNNLNDLDYLIDRKQAIALFEHQRIYKG